MITAKGGSMDVSLWKHPSGFLPVAMSFAALTTVLVFVALHGTARQADEGAAAHIWQFLMAAQAPIVLYFAIRWVPQAPRQALPILAMQVAATLAAMAPVFFLHW
jgi:hypothetical protein